MKINFVRNTFYLVFSLFSFICFGQNYEGELVPYRKGSKWGYSDTCARIILKPIYSTACFFERGYANVILKGVGGHINRKGEFTKGYMNQGSSYTSGQLTQSENYRINKFKAFENQYDSLEYLTEKTRKAYLNGRCGVIGEKNNVLLNIDYDTIRYGGANMYILVKDSKYGFVDSAFDKIILPQYDFVFKFNDGYALVVIDGKKMGFVNKSNVRFFQK